jgi:Leucine-rich repeat (LRR) protein
MKFYSFIIASLLLVTKTGVVANFYYSLNLASFQCRKNKISRVWYAISFKTLKRQVSLNTLGFLPIQYTRFLPWKNCAQQDLYSVVLMIL